MKPDTGGFTANYFYAVRTSTHCSLKAKNDPSTFAGRVTPSRLNIRQTVLLLAYSCHARS